MQMFFLVQVRTICYPDFFLPLPLLSFFLSPWFYLYDFIKRDQEKNQIEEMSQAPV